jgi:hypothetical protein
MTFRPKGTYFIRNLWGFFFLFHVSVYLCFKGNLFMLIVQKDPISYSIYNYCLEKLVWRRYLTSGTRILGLTLKAITIWIYRRNCKVLVKKMIILCSLIFHFSFVWRASKYQFIATSISRNGSREIAHFMYVSLSPGVERVSLASSGTCLKYFESHSRK